MSRKPVRANACAFSLYLAKMLTRRVYSRLGFIYWMHQYELYFKILRKIIPKIGKIPIVYILV